MRRYVCLLAAPAFINRTHLDSSARRAPRSGLFFQYVTNTRIRIFRKEIRDARESERVFSSETHSIRQQYRPRS